MNSLSVNFMIRIDLWKTVSTFVFELEFIFKVTETRMYDVPIYCRRNFRLLIAESVAAWLISYHTPHSSHYRVVFEWCWRLASCVLKILNIGETMTKWIFTIDVLQLTIYDTMASNISLPGYSEVGDIFSAYLLLFWQICNSKHTFQMHTKNIEKKISIL